jgi:radical SAM superfamily enzyme YgiQ (UPF0313 family)
VNGKLRVLLAQLPVPNNPSLNTPLAAGYLKAYACAQAIGDFAEIELLPRYLADRAGDALLVDAIVAREPDVLGISLYTWNGERSLDLARRVKQQLPELRVVAGGPEVQKDNLWVLEHPSIDVAVIGEGEQTFADLLRLWGNRRRGDGLRIPLLGAQAAGKPLDDIAGIAYRLGGSTRFTRDRVPLSDLSVIPSPYLGGYLDVPEDGMLMVEVSRWCPYACSFCLYGRNAGSKLGNRYFGLERVLAEIKWGREQGIRRVHFVEANLNLVPLFWPLMRALEDLNADRQMTFYAELRGEHLTEDIVAALERANVRYVEVGLQTANPAALKASLRRTDLRKWAAGTRRLYTHGIEVDLDVILGLPADDEAGVQETLSFIRREELGPYDVFTLQVLPGTTVRQQAQQYGLSFQDRPPYYVLSTDRLGYADLRRLRRELKSSADLDPDEIEGCPVPRSDALRQRRNDVPARPSTPPRTTNGSQHPHDQPSPAADDSKSATGWLPTIVDAPVEHIWLADVGAAGWAKANESIYGLASHVDIVGCWADAAKLAGLLGQAINANPTTLFDCYLLAEHPPAPAELRAWVEALPHQPGYLDRVAVYSRRELDRHHDRVSPRLWLALPWTAQIEPVHYAGIAEIVWEIDLAEIVEPPLGAWRAAGGAGVWIRGRSISGAEASVWAEAIGGRVWIS